MTKLHAMLALVAVAIASPAIAQVSLENKVMKETQIRTADGGVRTQVAPARSLAPGATAVYVMTYRNGGRNPATNLVISNPISKDVAYSGVGPNSATPEVSVDGGRTFGQLSSLRVPSETSMRAAKASDVTDVRWVVAGPVAPGTTGSVSYRGTVK